MDTTGKSARGDFPPGLAQPARRALAAAGCANLAQLARFREEEVRGWHGIGPRALAALREALKANGLDFTKGENSLTGADR